jgi:hypothetical protein
MIRNSTDPILKFNEREISIADETIPKTSTNPMHPWFNDECKDAKMITSTEIIMDFP